MHVKKVISVYIVGVRVCLHLIPKHFNHSLRVFRLPHPAYPLCCTVCLRVGDDCFGFTDQES